MPPDAPLPTPAAPPLAIPSCSLDFLSSYNPATHEVSLRSDGHLASELLLVNLLLGRWRGAGTHVSYPCMVRTHTALQCLDVAGPATLRGFATARRDVEWRFGNGRWCNASTAPRRPGDGVLNTLDFAVLFWAHQAAPPYILAKESTWSSTPTVDPRHDMGARCDAAADELEWNVAALEAPCGVPLADNQTDSTVASVHPWASLPSHGAWIWFHLHNIFLAVELHLTGISVEHAIELSNDPAPQPNCTADAPYCLPSPAHANNLVLRFVRHAEYGDTQASTQSCGPILRNIGLDAAMHYGIIAARQQPTQACGFDLLLWVPHAPISGIHLAHSTECGGSIGVMRGSSAIDGVEGTVQRRVHCLDLQESYASAITSADGRRNVVQGLYRDWASPPPPPPPVAPPTSTNSSHSNSVSGDNSVCIVANHSCYSPDMFGSAMFEGGLPSSVSTAAGHVLECCSEYTCSTTDSRCVPSGFSGLAEDASPPCHPSPTSPPPPVFPPFAPPGDPMIIVYWIAIGIVLAIIILVILLCRGNNLCSACKSTKKVEQAKPKDQPETRGQTLDVAGAFATYGFRVQEEIRIARERERYGEYASLLHHSMLRKGV